MLKTLKIAALLGALALCGCADNAGKLRDGDMIPVAKSDSKMNAALAKGKATLPQFVAALENPKTSQSHFAVYARFVENGEVEFLWIDPVVKNGANFRGIVANAPEMLSKIKEGDRIIVPAADATDWMYVENGKLVGAHTTRVLRDSLSDGERAEFDKGMPYSFD